MHYLNHTITMLLSHGEKKFAQLSLHSPAKVIGIINFKEHNAHSSTMFRHSNSR